MLLGFLLPPVPEQNLSGQVAEVFYRTDIRRVANQQSQNTEENKALNQTSGLASSLLVNVHQVGLATIIYSYNTTICKNLYLIVTFRSPFELHEAYGYVTMMMSMWPKYGHRSLVGCKLPHLCSYSWPPCVCRLTPLSCLVLRWFSLSKIVEPDQSRGAQKRSGIHEQQNIDTGRPERYGSRNQQVSHNRSRGKRESCHWLVRCHDLRHRKSVENKTTQSQSAYAWRPTEWTETGSLQPTNDLWLYFGHVLVVNVTWPYAWWRSPLANKTSQLGTDFCVWLCYMNILSWPHPFFILHWVPNGRFLPVPVYNTSSPSSGWLKRPFNWSPQSNTTIGTLGRLLHMVQERQASAGLHSSTSVYQHNINCSTALTHSHTFSVWPAFVSHVTPGWDICLPKTKHCWQMTGFL